MRSAHWVQHRPEYHAEDGRLCLLRLVDRATGQSRVVEHHPDRRVRRSDRRLRHPAASGDPGLASVVLDDRAVLEHRERYSLVRRAAQCLSIGRAEIVDDLMLVDDGGRQIHPPRPQHHIPRRIEHEDAYALEPNPIAGELDRASEDEVGILYGPNLVEHRQQRIDSPAGRSRHDLGRRHTGLQDAWPVRAASGRPPFHAAIYLSGGQRPCHGDGTGSHSVATGVQSRLADQRSQRYQCLARLP